MSNMDLDPAAYDAQITEREPVGHTHTGAGDATNFAVAMPPKRAPKPVVVDQIPADIEVDDAKPVIVEATQERAARDYNTLILNLAPGSQPVRIVGDDANRSRLVLTVNNNLAVRVGPLSAYPDQGMQVAPLTAFETQVSTAIYAWNVHAETAAVLSAWIERN